MCRRKRDSGARSHHSPAVVGVVLDERDTSERQSKQLRKTMVFPPTDEPPCRPRRMRTRCGLDGNACPQTRRPSRRAQHWLVWCAGSDGGTTARKWEHRFWFGRRQFIVCRRQSMYVHGSCARGAHKVVGFILDRGRVGTWEAPHYFGDRAKQFNYLHANHLNYCSSFLQIPKLLFYTSPPHIVWLYNNLVQYKLLSSLYILLHIIELCRLASWYILNDPNLSSWWVL
jgi:hypothetical protein